jgi:hypothetical protein
MPAADPASPSAVVAAPSPSSSGSNGVVAVFGLVAGVGLAVALVALGAWIVRRRWVGGKDS